MTKGQACDVLGIRPDADGEEVLAAHRGLVRVWHPDLHFATNESEVAEERLKQINHARDILLEGMLPPEEQASTTAEAPEAPESRPPTIYNLGPNKREFPMDTVLIYGSIVLGTLLLLVIFMATSDPNEAGEKFYSPPAQQRLSPEAPTLWNQGSARILRADEVR